MSESGEHRTSRPSVARPRTVARPPSAEERAAARTITLAEADTTVARVIAALPAPEELPEGTLVVVPGKVVGAASLAQSVLAVFGRSRSVSRVVRCSALVARGYVDVGAATDDARADLSWGRAPSPSATGRDSGS